MFTQRSARNCLGRTSVRLTFCAILGLVTVGCGKTDSPTSESGDNAGKAEVLFDAGSHYYSPDAGVGNASLSLEIEGKDKDNCGQAQDNVACATCLADEKQALTTCHPQTDNMVVLCNGGTSYKEVYCYAMWDRGLCATGAAAKDGEDRDLCLKCKQICDYDFDSPDQLVD